jgi:surface protein
MVLMLLFLPAGMVAQTEASSSKYIATYESSTQTLTFKKNVGETLPENSAWVEDKQMVSTINKKLGNGTIVHIVFDKSFGTYTPTSLYSFFENLPKLETITGLEYLNTEKVTNMSRMFYYCSKLTSLDVTHFNTENVTDMGYMFLCCSKLSSLDVSHFNTAKVTKMNSMFSSCSKLTSLDVTHFNTEKVTEMNSMFYNCSSLTSLDVSHFNTAKVTKMDGMFSGCSKLTSLDVTHFDTEKVTDMNKMFYDCSSLTSLDVSKFNTANVTVMYSMFCKCSSLTSLDVSKFNTANVKNMNSMFTGCSELTSLDVSNFNTANVRDMYYMFAGCLALTSLDVTNFNTANVINMSGMFFRCSELTSLDVTNFNTANVTDMSGMFYECISLKLLDVAKFNTANVKSMSNMFYNCQNLASLNVTNFNTANVTNMQGMFYSCPALTTIYASDKFVTTNVETGSNMFFNCIKLKGFIDYRNNSDKTDHTYANYKTGYFTKLVGKNGDEKIGATGEPLATDNLVLDDNKDFVAYEPFAAKAASYNRTMNAGTAWGTLCLPFAIVQSQETECKFYRLTGIDNDNDCITLESYEEGAKIPAGTPVLFKMNEGKTSLSLSASNAEIATAPTVAGTNTDVNLVGSFTKIGGKDNQGLADTDYIIGKDKFWRVSDLSDGKGVGIKPMRAYIHPATASQARAAMLSIGKGDGTTAIDNLNAISNDANAEYYDANGRRTNGLQKGLNIVKRGSKTYKIMVK